MIEREPVESANVNENLERPPLSIRNAVIQFCFEERVEDVQVCEQYFTSQQLAEFGFPNLGGTSNRGEPTDAGAHQGEFRRRLVAAWEGLLLDFRQRLERGQIVITGVQTHPKPTTDRTIIPGLWATDFRIDALNNTVMFRQTRYVAIFVGEPGCFPKAVAETTSVAVEPTSERLTQITPESVRDLTDEEVLLLLEEHAKRVIASPDGMLIAPGKVTFLPLARGKMRHRADQGDLLPTLTAEAHWLNSWIVAKVTLLSAPSAKTIGKVLGTEYSLLMARSKAAIQT